MIEKEGKQDWVSGAEADWQWKTSKNPDVWKKVEEFAHKAMEETPSVPSESMEPEVDGKWRQLNSRKWEFRWNGLVLATIFHKPNNKYSLWYKVPNLYEKVIQNVALTFLFDSFEEAKNSFPRILRERMKIWCETVLDFLYVE